jgi:hypothetical protein
MGSDHRFTLSTAARNFGQQIEREDSMKVDLEFEFDAEELASIASHRGKESASEAEVRSFIREAITKALGMRSSRTRQCRMIHPRT